MFDLSNYFNAHSEFSDEPELATIVQNYRIYSLLEEWTRFDPPIKPIEESLHVLRGEGFEDSGQQERFEKLKPIYSAANQKIKEFVLVAQKGVRVEHPEGHYTFDISEENKVTIGKILTDLSVMQNQARELHYGRK